MNSKNITRIAGIFLIIIFAAFIINYDTITTSLQNIFSNTPKTQTPQSTGFFKSIPPIEAKKLIDRRPDIILLDVRTQREFRRHGAIPNSQLVSFMAVMRNHINLPKDQAIILICAVGGRSYTAGQMLRQYGYHEIYNLSGGISAWRRARLPFK